jgi:tetratricopeptide (TPR) repeat protein
LVPIWILPPYLFLSQTSANAPFFPKHLIFILPIYLLFVAHGIKNICELVSHLARGSSGKQTLLYGFCLVLAASGLSLANVQSLNHYYEGKKEDWRGTAALLAELVKPGDLIVQLTQWPTDPLPYYVESREEFDAVQLEELRSIDGDEFAATVWWVILIGQSGSTLSILPDPEQMVGADFDIRVLDSLPYKSPAIVRREQPIGDGAEFWRLTTKLLLVQAQADAWIKLWWYEDRLAEILELVGRSEVDLGACPPSSLDLVRAVGEAWEQAQEGDRKQAADTLLEAFAMHEVLFPGSERLHDGVIQALRKLANDTLVDGEQACADLFLARAVDAYVVAGQAEPERAEYWYGLATAAYELGRTKEASEAFERLLKLEPGNWQFHLEAAEAFWASGWQEETITALRRAADLAPNESRPHRRMADYYFLQGQMEQAALGFQRVLDLDPQDSEARFGLALAYEGQGRTAEAIQQLEDLIELDPHHWLVTEAQEKLTELKR